jgi:hypothetical protein
MSQSETANEKDTWDTLKELREKTEARMMKEINQAVPAVQRSLGATVDAATKGFDMTMKSISSHTEKEQLELLRAYRRFLSGQLKFVDFRLKEIEKRAQVQQSETTQAEMGRAAQRAYWYPAELRV